MHTNNFVPTIIERSARKAAHRFCRDYINLSSSKRAAHRAYRRHMNIEMHKLINNHIEYDEFDDSVPKSIRLTSWDVW